MSDHINIKPLDSFDKVIFFARETWDLFHISLANEIRNNFPYKEIVFASFSSRALVRPRKSGYQTFYFPDMFKPLEKLPVDELQMERVNEEIKSYDSELDLDLILSSERFAPAESEKLHHFCWKHVAVLDDFIGPKTLAFYGAVDHFVYWLANILVNQRGGAFFGINICGIPARTQIMRDPWTIWVGEPDQNCEVAWAAEKDRLEIPTEERLLYMNPTVYKGPSIKKRLFRYFFYELYYERKDGFAGSYFSRYQGFLPFISGWLRQRRQRNQFKDFPFEIESLESPVLDNIQPYFFVPFHLEPEATILMYSPWLKDQLKFCQILSKILPEGNLLLIKDNPKMRTKRDHGFYRELEKLPNIKLVAPWVPAVPLIKSAKGVVTLAGNASLEAALLGVPSICMGRPPFGGILGGQHFATRKGLRIEDLENWLKFPSCKNPASVSKEWARWLSGTIKTQAYPRWNILEKQIEPSRELKLEVLRFVTSALHYRNIRQQ